MPQTNVYNQDDIPSYLERMAEEDRVLGHYLTLCLEKALRKDGYWIQPVTQMPSDAPEWVRQKWDMNGPWHKFTPDAHLDGQVRHIADWIKAAMVDEEAWLMDLDEKGRPKVLGQIGTMEQAINKANKAMEANRQKAGTPNVEEDGINLRGEMALANGFRIVRLLTPQALDGESNMLGHCVGGGAYDERVKSEKFAYYSLRDKSSKSHATFEVNAESNTLLQCRGKQNAPPVSKYMPYVRQFVERKQFALAEAPSHTGLVKVGTQYHDIHRLPENLHVDGDFVLSDTRITKLPENLHVDGDLVLSDTRITKLPENLHVNGYLGLRNTNITALPDNLHVGGGLNLSFSRISELPENFSVGGRLNLSNTPITALPDNLCVRGDLDLNNTPITGLPDNLHVGSSLYLSNTPITSLPDNLHIRGDLNLNNTPITALPENLHVDGYLDLNNTPITGLPDNLHVGSSLYLSNTPITSLPDNLHIRGDLNLSGTPITALPNNLRVGGDLYLSDTPITALPENLHVDGYLGLSNTLITGLPDNLHIGGSLNLSNTLITELPDNLHIGGSLNLSDTPIMTLPNNLYVDGHLNLSNTPITALPDNLRVSGHLALPGALITAQPDNLRVKGRVIPDLPRTVQQSQQTGREKEREPDIKFLYLQEVKQAIHRAGKVIHDVGARMAHSQCFQIPSFHNRNKRQDTDPPGRN